MYLRFIGRKIDLRSGNPQGIFTIAYGLLDSDELMSYEFEIIKELLVWFSKNLRVPDRFSRKRNSSHKNEKGLSWIKSESSEAVSKLMELKALLEMRGILIDVQKTHKPGYIVYEDEHQVVAEPFNRNRINLI